MAPKNQATSVDLDSIKDVRDFLSAYNADGESSGRIDRVLSYRTDIEATIKFKCEHCGTTGHTSRRFSGSSGACRRCKGEMTIGIAGALARLPCGQCGYRSPLTAEDKDCLQCGENMHTFPQVGLPSKQSSRQHPEQLETQIVNRSFLDALGFRLFATLGVLSFLIAIVLSFAFLIALGKWITTGYESLEVGATFFFAMFSFANAFFLGGVASHFLIGSQRMGNRLLLVSLVLFACAFMYVAISVLL